MGSASESNLKIIIERNPSEARLSELGIKSWPKWGCPPGKMTLKYEATETCYFVRGKVKAYPSSSSSTSSSSSSSLSSSTSTSSSSSSVEEAVEFGVGDIVIFPKGLSCTWDVSVAVDKFYKFDPP